MVWRTRMWKSTIAAGLMCLGVSALASARQTRTVRSPGPEAPVTTPTPTPTVAAPARNPGASAHALTSLARFARGALTDSLDDRRLAASLGQVTNARAAAQRIVAGYEAMSLPERSRVFGGLTGLEHLTTRGIETSTKSGRGPRDATPTAKLGAALPQRSVLPPDPVDTTRRAQFELAYRGMTVHQGVDSDGTDEPVVFAGVLWAGGADEPFPIASRYLPERGTLGVAHGASSGAGAGTVWSGTTWPSGWNSGVVMVSAVLEDHRGDLQKRQEELQVVLSLARSLATDNPDLDRMRALQGTLEDCFELLHLAGGSTWSAGAVQARLLTAADYDQLYTQTPHTTPFVHKLAVHHHPRGGDYSLYFDLPSPQVALKTVSVTVKQVEALGPERDRFENRQADFGLDLAIHGATPASISRTLLADRNLVKPGWTVERQVQAGSNVLLVVRLWDRDPPPKYACLAHAGWPHGVCDTYCADEPLRCTPGAQNAQHCPTYSGTCPAAEIDYDINVLPDHDLGNSQNRTNRELRAVFDLGSNTLSGDITGPPGTYTLTGTPGAANQARIVLEIAQK